MKILHISDLHFGTEIKNTVEVLVEAINEMHVDIIVISGDFTQRARTKQFKAAQDFLKRINNKNILCVPGNHDIALHNFFERFFMTYEKYKTFITENFNPYFSNGKVAILGINSTTPFKIQDGIVSPKQLKITYDFFNQQPEDAVKIIVMHHNMIRPEFHKVIDNLEEVIHTLAECKVSLILSGHLHDACMEKITRNSFSHNMYVITAGTAISRRLRSQPNSFNLYEIDRNSFKFQVFELNEGKFIGLQEKEYPL